MADDFGAIQTSVNKVIQDNSAAIIRRLNERLDANSEAAGRVALASWQHVLSGPPHSSPGQAPGEVSGALKDDLNVRTYVRRRNFSGFIIKPGHKKFQSILGRFERGYYRTDSAGRTYHEPPRPSVRRAWSECKAACLHTLFRP